jgi:hypothetical protein
LRTAAAGPHEIVLAGNGALWFTDSGANKIGELIPARARCLVPRLKGRTLAQAKRLLSRAHCALGKLSVPSRHAGQHFVRSQAPSPHTSLPAGGKVSVRLG